MGCETIWTFEDNIHVFWTEQEISGFGLFIVDTFFRDVSKDADTPAAHDIFFEIIKVC